MLGMDLNRPRKLETCKGIAIIERGSKRNQRTSEAHLLEFRSQVDGRVGRVGPSLVPDQGAVGQRVEVGLQRGGTALREKRSDGVIISEGGW